MTVYAEIPATKIDSALSIKTDGQPALYVRVNLIAAAASVRKRVILWMILVVDMLGTGAAEIGSSMSLMGSMYDRVHLVLTNRRRGNVVDM